MDKIKFSWSNYLQKADSLVDFVKTSEPEVILEKIYGEILTTIQKEPEFYEYYLKTAKKVKKCCKKLRRQIDPRILHGDSDSNEIDADRFKQFMKHILTILVEHEFPLFNPEKQDKLAEFFCSFLQNDPQDERYFSPPFDYLPSDSPAKNKAGSPLFQKCQSIFVFYYLVGVLQQYLYISNEDGRLFIRLRPQDGSDPPNQYIEPKGKEKKKRPEEEEMEIKEEYDHEQPSTSKDNQNMTPTEKSPSGLDLVTAENRMKVSFSWKKCLEKECNLFEEIGYGTVQHLVKLIYGQPLFDAWPQKVKEICLSLAGKVRSAHLQLFHEEMLDFLYPEDSLELSSDRFFEFIHKALKAFTETCGFPFLSSGMVDRAANFLTVFLQNSPAVVKNFWPSPLIHKDITSFSRIKLVKVELDKMVDCHTLFFFHYITQFIKKLVRLKKSSIGERLELRPRADVLSAIYFNDLEMVQYMINHPKELIISRQGTLAPKETIKWSEYLQQPCTLFEEVSSLSPKSLLELVFGNSLLENALLNTKEVCTAIVKGIAKNHSHLFLKKDLDLLYHKDSFTLHRGPVFHFLLQCLKRTSAPINARQGLFATIDIHKDVVFYSNLLFLPANKANEVDLAAILLPKKRSDFAKKEDKRLVADLHKQLTVFFFKYMLSFFRKFVTLSSDEKKLILKPKSEVEKSVYLTGNARKYYSNFQIQPTRRLLNQPESMIQQILTSSAQTFVEKMIGQAVFQALTAQGSSILCQKATKLFDSLKRLINDFQEPEFLQKKFNNWPKTAFNKFASDNLALLLSMVTVPFTEAFDDLLPIFNRGELNKNLCATLVKDFFNGTKVLKEEDFDFCPVECPFIDALPSMIQESLKEETLDIQQAMYFNSMYFYAFYAISWVMRLGELQKYEKDLLKQTLRACSMVKCRYRLEEMKGWIREPTSRSHQEEERVDDDMVILGVFEKAEKEPLWTMDIGSSDDEDDEKEKSDEEVEGEPQAELANKKTPEVPPPVRKIKEEPKDDDLWVIGTSKKKKAPGDDSQPLKKIKQEKDAIPERAEASKSVKQENGVENEGQQPSTSKRIKEEPREVSKKRGKENQNQPTSAETLVPAKKIKEEPKDKESEEEEFWVVYSSNRKKKGGKGETEETIPVGKVKTESGSEEKKRNRAREEGDTTPVTKKKKKTKQEVL